MSLNRWGHNWGNGKWWGQIEGVLKMGGNEGTGKG